MDLKTFVLVMFIALCGFAAKQAKAAVWVGDRCFADVTTANDFYFAQQKTVSVYVPIPNTSASSHPTTGRIFKSFYRRFQYQAGAPWLWYACGQAITINSLSSAAPPVLPYAVDICTNYQAVDVISHGVGYEVAGSCPVVSSAGGGSSSDMSLEIWGFPTQQAMSDVFSWFFITPLVLYLVAWSCGVLINMFNRKRGG